MGELGRLRVGSASRRNADSQIDTLRAGRHAEILSRRRMQASSADDLERDHHGAAAPDERSELVPVEPVGKGLSQHGR